MLLFLLLFFPPILASSLTCYPTSSSTAVRVAIEITKQPTLRDCENACTANAKCLYFVYSYVTSRCVLQSDDPLQLQPCSVPPAYTVHTKTTAQCIQLMGPMWQMDPADACVSQFRDTETRIEPEGNIQRSVCTPWTGSGKDSTFVRVVISNGTKLLIPNNGDVSAYYSEAADRYIVVSRPNNIILEDVVAISCSVEAPSACPCPPLPLYQPPPPKTAVRVPNIDVGQRCNPNDQAMIQNRYSPAVFTVSDYADKESLIYCLAGEWALRIVDQQNTYMITSAACVV